MKKELFVSGRLCLFGEHSDWAGAQRLINGTLEKGMAIVSGIEQGIHAWIEKSDRFDIYSFIDNEKIEFHQNLEVKELRNVAIEGGVFSYMAGVASYMKENYQVGGVKIVIDSMTMPIKRGLSSSAAVCVLVAKAFNILYNLNMSTYGIMQAAYCGEQRTPSRCGRLDQACAFGTKTVAMVFDGSDIEVEQIKVKGEFYWGFANLNANKDTIKILADLGKCYPFAQNEMERKVQRALGEKNREIIQRALLYFRTGNHEALGRLMTEAQEVFDQEVAPACPEQLTAPILHAVLEDPVVKKYTYGIKGVGSQGDGTVQFLAKDKEAQEKLLRYFEEEKGMKAYGFTICQQRKIRRAIIPVAGLGTRVFPETLIVKKEFFPIVDRDNLVKPLILLLLKELDDAGIENICIVIGEEDKKVYEEFFDKAISDEYYTKLSSKMQECNDFIKKISGKVEFVVQKECRGFGHAVLQCRKFAHEEPVLLLLGDTVYQSNIDISCIEQLIKAYEKTGKMTVGLSKVPFEETGNYGIVTGRWEDADERFLNVEKIYEKPSSAAKEELGIEMSGGEREYYMFFGNYILTPEVFTTLEKNVKSNATVFGEIQLTNALDEVRAKCGMMAYRIEGEAFDIGNPSAFRRTVSRFGIEKGSCETS